MGSKEVLGEEKREKVNSQKEKWQASTKSKVVKWATIGFFIALFIIPLTLGLVMRLEKLWLFGIAEGIMLPVLVLNGLVVLTNTEVGCVERLKEPTGRVIKHPGINFVLPLVDKVRLFSFGSTRSGEVIIELIPDQKNVLRFARILGSADNITSGIKELQEKGDAKKTVPLVFSLPVLIVGTIVVVVWLIWLGQPPKTVDVKEEAVVVLLQGFKKPTKVKRKDLPLGILYFKGPPSASVNVQFVEDKCWPRNNVIRARGDIRTFFKEIPQEVNEIYFFGPKGLEVEIRKKN